VDRNGRRSCRPHQGFAEMTLLRSEQSRLFPAFVEPQCERGVSTNVICRPCVVPTTVANTRKFTPLHRCSTVRSYTSNMAAAVTIAVIMASPSPRAWGALLLLLHTAGYATMAMPSVFCHGQYNNGHQTFRHIARVYFLMVACCKMKAQEPSAYTENYCYTLRRFFCSTGP